MHFKTRILVETARQRPMRSPPGAVLEGERRLPTRIRGCPDKRGQFCGDLGKNLRLGGEPSNLGEISFCRRGRRIRKQVEEKKQKEEEKGEKEEQGVCCVVEGVGGA